MGQKEIAQEANSLSCTPNISNTMFENINVLSVTKQWRALLGEFVIAPSITDFKK